jgi:hypothetical protein
VSDRRTFPANESQERVDRGDSAPLKRSICLLKWFPETLAHDVTAPRCPDILESDLRSPVTIACRPKPKEIELPNCQRTWREGRLRDPHRRASDDSTATVGVNGLIREALRSRWTGREGAVEADRSFCTRARSRWFDGGTAAVPLGLFIAPSRGRPGCRAAAPRGPP